MAVPAYNRNENRLEVLNKLDEVHHRITRIYLSHPILQKQEYTFLKEKIFNTSLDLVSQISYANSLSTKNRISAKMRLEAQYEGRKYMYQLIVLLQTVLQLEDCIDTEAFEEVLAILTGDFKTIFYSWTAKTLEVIRNDKITSSSLEKEDNEDKELSTCTNNFLKQALQQI